MHRLLLITLLVACGSEPTGPLLQIDIKTDYVPGEDFDAIRVQVGTGDLGTYLEHIVDPVGDYRRGRRIGSAPAARGQTLVSADLIRDGTVVERREAVASIEGDINTVTIVITRDCAGVMCPFPGGDAALRSCYGGLCADPRCTTETPEFCPSACEGNDDCPQSGCRSAYCDLGACFSVPDDTACSSGERCRSDGVCVPSALDGGVSFDGGIPVDGAVDAGCVVGERECAGSVLRECTALGYVETTCDLGCGDTGTTGCLEFVPSILMRPRPEDFAPPAVIPAGRWDTDMCEDLAGFWYVQATPGEVEICVLAFESVTFSGGDLRVVGSRGLAVVSNTDILVEGAILADARGRAGGPGGASASGGPAGVVALSGQDGEHMGAFDDGGGGGGGGFGAGGAGGRGGVARGGAGGPGHGPGYALFPLRGGGAGGVGGTGESAGQGGGGGGALQLSARGDIIVRGLIAVSGGGGGGGGDGTAADANIGAGGGGGGGGSLLLEAAGNVHVDAPRLISAGGGGGGGAAGCAGRGDGGDGSEDGVFDGGASGPQCGGTTFGADGGSGSADADGMAGGGIMDAGGNGGGGGGGGGLVVFRASTTSGTLTGSGHRVFDGPTLVVID